MGTKQERTNERLVKITTERDNLQKQLDLIKSTKLYIQTSAFVLFTDNTWEYYRVLLIEVHEEMQITDELISGYIYSKWSSIANKKQSRKVVLDDRSVLRWLDEPTAKHYDPTLE